MNKLLLITGDLAAGKSTLAYFLSKRYKINIFTKDTLKEILSDSIGFANREENKKLSNAAINLMLFQLNEFCQLSKDLILESNFHTHELEKIHQIASKYNYEVCTLVLRGDVDILYSRYINRIQNENRHPIHLSTTLDQYDDFKHFIEKQEKKKYLEIR